MLTARTNDAEGRRSIGVMQSIDIYGPISPNASASGGPGLVAMGELLNRYVDSVPTMYS